MIIDTCCVFNSPEQSNCIKNARSPFLHLNFSTTSQGDCPANDAKRAFDTVRGDDVPLDLSRPSNASHPVKRLCTPDVRSVPKDSNAFTHSSEELTLTWSKEPVGASRGVNAPDLLQYDATKSVLMGSGGPDQCRSDFHINNDGLTTNHLVYQEAQYLFTDNKNLPTSHTGSPTFGIQSPENRLGHIPNGSKNPTCTGFLQMHDQDSLTTTGYEAPKLEFERCFGTVCTFANVFGTGSGSNMT